jgi:hypothetical protein
MTTMVQNSVVLNACFVSVVSRATTRFRLDLMPGWKSV